MSKNYRAELVGVIGNPVDGNPTGVMEEAGFAALGLDFRYLTIKVLPQDLEDAIRGVRAFHMRGINLTMPHKVQVIPYLDELTEAAGIIGAVNTVINQDGKLIGENTDGKGFMIALENEGIPVKGTHITMLGAGGAAKAIAVECALAGASEIKIINRDKTRGVALAELITSRTGCTAEYIPWTEKKTVPADTNILINGTSAGLFPDIDMCPDLDYATIHEGMTVCDVVFNPVDPLFLQKSRANGARTVNGIGMLVNQGAMNFRLWTGREAPVDVMYKTLEAEFSEE